MPNFRPLPPISRLREVFKIDSSCPSGLRNLETRGRLRAGLPAGNKSTFYWVVGIDGHYYNVQRIVYAIHYGVDPGDNLVDHINRDRFDNRVSNLRLVNYTVNAANCGIYAHNTTGVRGVSYNKRDRIYYAQIKLNQKAKHLGSFSTVEEAAKARRAAELRYFGENC